MKISIKKWFSFHGQNENWEESELNSACCDRDLLKKNNWPIKIGLSKVYKGT